MTKNIIQLCTQWSRDEIKSKFQNIIHIHRFKGTEQTTLLFNNEEEALKCKEIFQQDYGWFVNVIDYKDYSNMAYTYIENLQSNFENSKKILQNYVSDEHLISLDNLQQQLNESIKFNQKYQKDAHGYEYISPQSAALYLIKLSDVVSNIWPNLVKDKEELELWQQSMRLFEEGKLSQHVDRYAHINVEFCFLFYELEELAYEGGNYE